MKPSNKGIHHITVLGGDGQRTTDFYVKTLGLRMIMKTVNQDDPSTYHLFYVNGTSQPGSSMTFFPWPMAVQGKPGSGESAVVSFAVPSGSIGYWAERFGEQDIDFDGPFERFEKQVVSFMDPDRLKLELVFDDSVNSVDAWDKGTVPAEYGIRGFWSTTMKITETEPTAALLEEVFGFEKIVTDGNQTLLQTGNRVGGSVILEKVEPKQGQNGRGIVHHVAFRAKDDEEHEEMREMVLERGFNPTGVIDRRFFKSVYFQSPGGVLFEIATDGPGYESAQNEEDLGRKLYLPERFESRREMIEKRLPEITV
ncbi:ring-cleaving dioxygenase [Rhodohalobacter sp. SW132]|uniref:VOC family protein n=1 Tax=Rhodohalobacter sp. SW132 TaxID=2293433 RepID=UPI000E24C259|nr:VOC family protein [Rhodohalobacter sp. SW132]REL37805.1 ring-cleaving dioxygenase [Rhodohalobacter sp. SW132]